MTREWYISNTSQMHVATQQFGSLAAATEASCAVRKVPVVGAISDLCIVEN